MGVDGGAEGSLEGGEGELEVDGVGWFVGLELVVVED